MEQKKSWIEMVEEFQRTFDAQNVSSDKTGSIRWTRCRRSN